MPLYKVDLSAHATVVVLADDEDQAKQRAKEDAERNLSGIWNSIHADDVGEYER